MALVTAGVGLGLIVLDDEFHFGAGEVAFDFVEIHLEALDHVFADLGKAAGHGRDEADAQFFRLRRRIQAGNRQCGAEQQRCNSSR